MYIFADLPTWILPVAIGVAVVIVGVVAFLLFKFVFVKKQMRHKIRDLDHRFDYLHALLIGQDSKYVKRLEVISNSNILYVSYYTDFSKRYRQIRDKQDTHAQNSMNHLCDLLEDKKYRALKEALADAKEEMNSYEEAVNSFNNDLLKIIKPEEDCRQSALALKEMERRIQSDYLSKKGDLQLVESSFDSVFKMLDDQFDQFEELVQSAHYEDANIMLPRMEKMLNELSSDLRQLPNLCALVINIIPDKIYSLENAAEAMTRENYPLHHLIVNSTIKDMRDQVAIITKKLKTFDLHGVESELNDIISRIDEFFTLFDEEKEARVVFENENENVYRVVNTIERRFIKLCNTIPEVSKIYIINEDHQSKINEIQNEINKLGALKRSLDTFIHSSTKQPYSLLVSKMKELNDASNIVIAEMDEFSQYLDSLKTDSEKAYSLLNEYYFQLKAAEKTIRDMNIEKVSNKYVDRINHFYELLDTVNGLVHQMPIDVDAVNVNVAEINALANEILGSGEIEQDRNMMVLAENAILYANRDRMHLSDIQQLVTQAETLFQNGDFENAYIAAGNALKKVSSESSNKE